MEQGSVLNAMIENFRMNEDKTLYKEHAEDIQLMRDLTATINYKYVALIAQNRIEAEKAHLKDAQRIEQLEREKQDLLNDQKTWRITMERNSQLEHEVNELKEMLHKLENKIEQMAAQHKNEVDNSHLLYYSLNICHLLSRKIHLLCDMKIPVVPSKFPPYKNSPPTQVDGEHLQTIPFISHPYSRWQTFTS